MPNVGKGLIAPLLAESVSMDWEMYEFKSSRRPPVEKIPKSNTVVKGQTFYDWSSRSMVEIYQDRCIDIFPTGRDFPCKFLSDHEKPYFIKFLIGQLK